MPAIIDEATRNTVIKLWLSLSDWAMSKRMDICAGSVANTMPGAGNRAQT